MFRSTLRILTKSKIANLLPVGSTRAVRPAICVAVPRASRLYATSPDPLGSGEDEAEKRFVAFMEKIYSSPRVLQALQDLGDLMEKKIGVTAGGEQPPVWKIFKLMQDPEAYAAMENFKKEMVDSGIEIQPEDFTSFIKIFGFAGNKTKQD